MTPSQSFSWFFSLPGRWHWFATDENYQVATQLFLKGLALIYFIAFASLSVQIIGLAGSNGILPFDELLSAYEQRFGPTAWLKIPTIFWLSAQDWALQWSTWLGCLLALLVFFERYSRFSLVLMFVLYLSLYHAGQTFLSFQWDLLLLEAGFLAIFLTYKKQPLVIVLFLLHWLLFRLRFLSGISKVLSGDPAWADFAALLTYFETQPLPHIGAWYAHQLPESILKTATALVLVWEIVIPLFIFLPRKFRIFAAVTTIVLQLLIMATSNHNFINLLTIVLCLLLLDDRFFQSLLPDSWFRFLGGQSVSHSVSLPQVLKPFYAVVFTLMMGISGSQIYWYVFNQSLTSPWLELARLGQRWGIGSVFHVFPTMQVERQELHIEGSYDGKTWYAYRFRYKPNDVYQAPRFNLPHQPRLDWMMWFVPPQFAKMNIWFEKFMLRLWHNQQEVTQLLAYNPFADKPPPRYLRVLAYRYRFTDFSERKDSGQWWKSEYLGEFPQVPPRRP